LDRRDLKFSAFCSGTQPRTAGIWSFRPSFRWRAGGVTGAMEVDRDVLSDRAVGPNLVV